NETSFRRQFSEFLQVQKNLPESILRKRQGDLQLAMERALAFRQQAEATLREAEAALIDRVRQRVDAAIRTVGQERGYELIIDTDSQSTPFVAPSLTEDATPWVAAKLQNAAR
ncbi:MAG: OmpH family outer membrane protein, partial [Bacteroidaceae bacterium]|nr:OmpH family outer membrane protein [Bacteroidaceae bacterium]